jgi:hypothetical protein
MTLLGEVLGPISGHSTQVYKRNLVIFGGTNGKKALDRMLVFYTET